ncbi:predicted protein [Histoplasma capsulatum H143]|uniref:Uncharacterized protein n=1 Tax=Ajellomyces capsulatus (strain H143) TaxID=544712 RepID=C6HRI1_AJECH|nr:predicted protein [Histoplasma capsulatum H143]
MASHKHAIPQFAGSELSGDRIDGCHPVGNVEVQFSLGTAFDSGQRVKEIDNAESYHYDLLCIFFAVVSPELKGAAKLKIWADDRPVNPRLFQACSAEFGEWGNT